MKRLILGLALAATLAATAAAAETITFSTADVKSIMLADGAPLSNVSNQWGLWAVRVMPIVTGGGYTITGGSTTQTGWGVAAPGLFGAAPYTAANSAWFYDISGAEVAGNPANPLYMIMDKAADTFTSYTFAGGTNVVTAVDATSLFSFSFALDAGAAWSGAYQFVVDGSMYTAGDSTTPGGWVDNFFGGYGAGGALPHNLDAGYTAAVPEPVFFQMGALLGMSGLGLLRLRRRQSV